MAVVLVVMVFVIINMEALLAAPRDSRKSGLYRLLMQAYKRQHDDRTDHTNYKPGPLRRRRAKVSACAHRPSIPRYMIEGSRKNVC